MKVRYVGDDNVPDDTETTAFGHTFTKGKVTEIDDEHPDVQEIAAKVKGNPHFERVGGAPKKVEEPVQKVEIVKEPRA